MPSATSASKKSWALRSCSPSAWRSSGRPIGPLAARRVNRPSSIALRSVFEPQNALPSCRILSGETVVICVMVRSLCGDANKARSFLADCVLGFVQTCGCRRKPCTLASLARKRDHSARADADVGQRATVKTYEELGGLAPPLAQPRQNSQDAQDVEDEHGRT